MSCSSEIANFIVETPGGSIQDPAIALAKQALVDFIGVAVAGSIEPVSKKIINFLRKNGDKEEAGVIATNFKTSVGDATLANSTMGHALDFDDSNFILGGHPSVTLFPALLSLGQKTGCSGRSLLEAYVIGFEVIMNIAKGINFEHYEKGWHPTATLGTFGAAAASARLLGLSSNKTAMSLGLAASMASGIKENFGTMAKPLQVGYACKKGVLCTLLASEGITSSTTALEGRQGFLNVYNGKGRYRLQKLTDFGDSWEIIRSGIMFKKYACCGTNHAVIDAAIMLTDSDLIEPENIESVVLYVNPRRLPHVNRPIVTNALEAKFSLQFAVTAALIDHEVGLRHFSEETINREDIKKLLSKVTVRGLEQDNDSLSQACELYINLMDGSTKSIRLKEASGRRAEDFALVMENKFLDCVQQVFPIETGYKLLSLLENIDQDPDVNSLMNMLVFK